MILPDDLRMWGWWTSAALCEAESGPRIRTFKRLLDNVFLCNTIIWWFTFKQMTITYQITWKSQSNYCSILLFFFPQGAIWWGAWASKWMHKNILVLLTQVEQIFLKDYLMLTLTRLCYSNSPIPLHFQHFVICKRRE